MITKLHKLFRLGKFKDYSWDSSLPDFNKINLIFGYNGSGKTTLSNTFRLYSDKNEDGGDNLFQGLSSGNDSKVIIEINGKKIKYSNSCKKENIYVFNSSFVREHVYEGTNLICKNFDKDVITKEQLKNPKINKLEIQLNEIEKELDKKIKKKKRLEKEFKRIKKDFSKKFNARVVGKHTPSMKIPKRLGEGLTENLEKKLEKTFDEYDLSKKQENINKDIKALKDINLERIKINKINIQNALSYDIAKKTCTKVEQKIEKYQKFNQNKITLIEWFEDGHYLLKQINEHSQNTCPLCGSDLKDRIKDILSDYQSYFSDNYNDAVTEIRELQEKIEHLIEIVDDNGRATKDLEVLEQKYSNLLETDQESIDDSNDPIIIELLKNIQKLLSDKKKNMAQISWDLSDIAWENLKKYNETIKSWELRKNRLIDSFPKDTLDTEKVINNIKELLYKCVIKKFNSSDEGDQINKYDILTLEIDEYEDRKRKLLHEKYEEISKLSNESKYVNHYLSRLGINNFTIFRDEKMDNISIQYKDGPIRPKLAYSLSESEKTTLAFAFFLSKIKYEVIDNDRNDLSETIIVIDDPVSSLDEGRLHVTACLIEAMLRDAKQLFIFSHNIIFMKFFSNILGRVKIRNHEGKKDGRNDYYLCGCTHVLTVLPSQLQNYRTTYFHRVSELIKYKNGEISYEEAKNYIPNRIRTVLEAFLSFKFCVLKQGSGNYKYHAPSLNKLINIIESKSSLFDDYEKSGTVNKDNLISTLKEIKRISDPQSHGNPQDIDEITFVSETELKSITKKTLNVLQFLDRIHLEALNN